MSHFGQCGITSAFGPVIDQQSNNTKSQSKQTQYARKAPTLRRLMERIDEESVPQPNWTSSSEFEGFAAESLVDLDKSQMGDIPYLQDRVKYLETQYASLADQLEQCKMVGGQQQQLRETAQWERSRTQVKNARLEATKKKLEGQNKQLVVDATNEATQRAAIAHKYAKEEKERRKEYTKEQEGLDQLHKELTALAAQVTQAAQQPVNASGVYVEQLGEAAKKAALIAAKNSLRKRELAVREREEKTTIQFVQDMSRKEISAAFEKGRAAGRNEGLQAGFYKGYDSGYFHGAKDNRNKATSKLVAAARQQGLSEGRKQEQENRDQNLLPKFRQAHAQILKEKVAEAKSKFATKYESDMAQHRTRLEQDYQRRFQDSQLEMQAFGHHKGTTTQLHLQYGLGDRVHDQDREDVAGAVVGEYIAKAVAGGTLNQSIWFGAFQRDSSLSMQPPVGSDPSKTQSGYLKSVRAACRSRGKELITEREAREVVERAEAERMAALQRAEDERIANKNREAFSEMNDLDGFTLKQRKPRPARPAPSLETNPDEAAAEDGFFPDPEDASIYLDYDQMFPETTLHEPLDQGQDYSTPAESHYDPDDFFPEDVDEYDGMQDLYSAQQNSFGSHYQHRYYQDEGDGWERMRNRQPYLEDVKDEEFRGQWGGPIDPFS